MSRSFPTVLFGVLVVVLAPVSAQEKKWITIPGVDRKIPTDTRVLTLQDSPVTDAGLKGIAVLKNLGVLILSNTQVTDAGLKELAGLKSLNFLDLRGTRVTDAGLKELAGLKSLTVLNLIGLRVTDGGLKELRAALPKCKILR